MVHPFTVRIPDPPASLARSGGFGRRTPVGRRWEKLIKETGLSPGGSVLDVGCGLGRIAVPLSGYLTDGRYEGFDIDAAAIEWCQQNITPLLPHFRFRTAAVFNDRYHAGGSPAETFRFPYEDGVFNLAFLASVFTHMVTAEVAHYLAELRRVLCPGGTLLASYFLLNDESETAIRQSRVAPRYYFPHALEGCRVRDRNVVSRAVAYPEAKIRALYEANRLKITKIQYGKWSGRDSAGNQDIVFATKM